MNFSMENKPGGIKNAHVVIKVVLSAGVLGHLTPNSRQPLELSTGEQEKK